MANNKRDQPVQFQLQFVPQSRHFIELMRLQKNSSPSSLECVSSVASITPMRYDEFQQMPDKPTPLFDLLDASEDISVEAKKSDAIQDHRKRTAGAVSPLLSRSHQQSYFAFDDESDGKPTTQPTSTNHQRDFAGRRQPLGVADTKRSLGNSSFIPERATGAAGASGPWLSKSKRNEHPLFDQIQDDSGSLPPPTLTVTGDKAKARSVLDAIRLLKQLENSQIAPSESEQKQLWQFGGFGAVARYLFPDPVTGQYKDHSWQLLGEELESLLDRDEYQSAKRTTFTAFYTSPTVINAMYKALDRLGVPKQSLLLEPGCGSGNFLHLAPGGKRFIGVELDGISGRIASLLHPEHDIRIENFRDTVLPTGRIDAVLGNVPFANIKLDYKGQKFSLHDFFFAKSLDALKPGGVLALVTSHFTLDKQNASIREFLADRADFLGAIRLPAEAFKDEGTKVIADILFLQKRHPDSRPQHVDNAWLTTGEKQVEGLTATVNQYFLNHPQMVLGQWTTQNSLYGEGYSIKGKGNLAQELDQAILQLASLTSKIAENSTPEIINTRFVRPPAIRHLTEGSLFVGDDQVIYHVESGTSTPVTHGATVLKANGTMMGKRLAGLIDLRDAARLVLQSQNESWPDPERDNARQELNQIYDRFTKNYGPINKTTFSESQDGTVTRRMPNLVKFRDDPDAMLVMSLEDYDEVTNEAQKVSIFKRDVVGKREPILQVKTAEEALIVSLDQTGGIDLPFMARLYGKDQEQISMELGDLIYLNPVTKLYETSDVYLSGNVRQKLAESLAAGDEFARNSEKLKLVQPPDILPGDIDANLGAPWIPIQDIQSFAAELFGVSPEDVRIGHLRKDAVWALDASYSAEQSVAATSDYGTGRINGTQLLELALNMRTPVIYDTIKTSSSEERVVNQVETLAAKEKQKLIKERFRQWIFADPDRTERLVHIYNHTYNNLRPRLFDGSHLQFPGMNETIDLRQHQKDAIWRVMSSGNTLLAHAVGAGKTFTMAATGMKLKQAGLVKKPMYVVPNHMLEQFAREFMQLYPNARLLVASKEDMSRDRRKFLTAKIASSDWDGIIVTHSSFERIGMSPDYQKQFLQEQINEYESLLTEVASEGKSGKHRNLIKTIEKQKANRENKLQELAAEHKKDDGLVFDELGVDHIFVDEAHYFKNLETPTKMDRVAGVQTGGSQRSFDLYMKARYLDQMHIGHGVTFATGTPISNTMVEMYNLQRFLDPHGLSERGIEHFDAWAANFGEVVESMEISPDGASLRPRSRFARFNNLPELQQMFRAFSDVQTAEMLDLPRPVLKDGKPQVVVTPMTDDQISLQSKLVERYERLRSQKVDPREDNALAITTDGRKLALDARMLIPDATDDSSSKLNALVENVVQIWQQTTPSRGTQLIFCDMGVNKTPWGFSAYDDIVHKLIKHGIPRDQIASIGDADSDARKQVLFEKVRNGSVRVLLGSTQKMGTGTNVQKRLVALHHADAPWKPAEVEQRDGRILRQGNLNSEVEIYRYVTSGSFDSFMWQALETKARFISQIMTGSTNLRRADDVGSQELSYAEVKAIASGNPAVLTLAETDAELQRLAILRKNHMDEQYLARRKLKELPDTIERLTDRLERLNADRETVGAKAFEPIVIGGRAVLQEQVHSVLAEALLRLPTMASSTTRRQLGEYHGLRFGLDLYPHSQPELYLEGEATRRISVSHDAGPRAIVNGLRRLEMAYGEEIEKSAQNKAVAEQQLEDFAAKLGRSFLFDDYANSLAVLREELKFALSERQQTDDHPIRNTESIVQDIESLRKSIGESSHDRSQSVQEAATAEEPITWQLQRRLSSSKEAVEVAPLLIETEEPHTLSAAVSR